MGSTHKKPGDTRMFFQGYTLQAQRDDENARGWDPSKASGGAYNTAEVVVIHQPNKTRRILEWEILEARRVEDKGILDCRGRWQGKWGTYLMPQRFPSALEAVGQCVIDNFGQNFPGEFHFAGNIGPWVHKARASIVHFGPQLEILPEQGEVTPFEAKLYAFVAGSKNFDPDGAHSRSTTGIQWVSLGDLISERGNDESYLYWLWIARAISRVADSNNHNSDPRYFKPGKYFFLKRDHQRAADEEELLRQ